MADRPISELTEATDVTPSDMFVLQQGNVAKQLKGSVFKAWALREMGSHGGISSITKKTTVGLTDTYEITYVDGGTYDFDVVNGRSIVNVAKNSTAGLVDTYKITYNDNSDSTFTVTNGAKGDKGDKGDNTYTWVKYSTNQPTKNADMHDTADNWIGIYTGSSSTAPTAYTSYTWYKIKGETGEDLTVISTTCKYAVGTDAGATSDYTTSMPAVLGGQFLWTQVTLNYNSGLSSVFYSKAKQGVDGSGAVSYVLNRGPDENENVTIYASDMTMAIDDGTLVKTAIESKADASTSVLANTSTTWSGSSAPYTQQLRVDGVTATNNILVGAGSMTATQQEAMVAAQIQCTAQAANSITLTAYGVKPTIALPIVVFILG